MAKNEYVVFSINCYQYISILFVVINKKYVYNKKG